MRRLLRLLPLVMCISCDDKVIEGLERGACGQRTQGITEVARPTTDLLDSFGVQVHFAFAEYADINKVVADLASLGMRHTRDDAGEISPMSTKAVGIKEAARRGIRTQLLLDRDDSVEELSLALGSALEAVEVPWPREAPGDFMTSEVFAKTKALRATIDGFPASRRLQLIGPLLGNQKGVDDIPRLDSFLDAGATWYPRPATAQSIAEQTARASKWAPGLPLVNVFGQHYPIKPGGSERDVTPAQQARYVLRFYLAQFRAGIVRAYYSQLYDAGDPFSYALATEQGVPKPSFFALQSLAAILFDAGPEPPSSPVAFTLQDTAPSSSELRHLILRRSDGTFVLIVWLDIASTPEETTRPVVVRFGGEVANVVLDSLHGLNVPKQTLKAAPTIELVVSDHPSALTFNVVCP